jgi:NhaP-type Na+/H+ or K+/H+ antiporter
VSALFAVALAAGFGLLAQLLAYRWRLPAIVLLLLFGVALGPSALGWVKPAALGGGLPVIVKLAVAVILFDGALNLRLADLRRSAREVRSLVTTGVLATWVGATLVAHYVARLGWPVAIVFGALVTVTGPTVVQPLLKRVQIPRALRATLEGEAILIDPIGALLAVAVLDIVLGVAGARPIGVLSGAWAYFGRLLVGLAVGLLGSLVLSRLLRATRWVPAELANLVALAGTWTAFAVAETLLSEAGIMAAVTMGLALQRGAVPEERRLRRFKEQLTVLGISILFILLAASLPLRVLHAEGWRGLAAVLALMLVVRPLSVALSLARSAMPWREKLFVMWIGPRGIVAASVASLFALSLGEAGFAEGERLLALTFLTIALTVTVHGLTASPLSRLLGLHSLAGRRVIVVGAGALGRTVAGVMRDGGRPVVLVDRNTELVEQARRLGLDAVQGNALDEATLEQVDAEEAETLVATTTNPEVNVLAVQLARDAFGIARAYPAIGQPGRGANERLLDRVGGVAAFGRPIDVRWWDYALERGDAQLVTYGPPAHWRGRRLADMTLPTDVIPVAVLRGDSAEIAHPGQTWGRGDRVVFLSRRTPAVTAALLEEQEGTAGVLERESVSRAEG